MNVSQTAQSGFQTKRLGTAKGFFDLLAQQTGRFDGARCRFQRGKSARDFVGIQKTKAFDLVRQKFPGEGGLARAVASGDEINRRRGHFRTNICPVSGPLASFYFGSRRRPSGAMGRVAIGRSCRNSGHFHPRRL